MFIIIDPGSSFTDIGFAGDDEPRFTIPSKLGNHPPPLAGDVVVNWGSMEALLNHIFEKLEVDPSEHSILMSDAAHPKGRSGAHDLTHV